MRITSIVAGFVLLVASAAQASAWQRYDNDRYGYRVDIPPGFSDVVEADNGDGGMSQSEDKLSQLAIWGANVTESSLAEEFRMRIESAKEQGWNISYRRETRTWASWSGSVDGRIFYARAIALCDGQAAYFLIEYPKARKKPFDPVIVRMVKSLKNARAC